jgi:hypothetical protein
VAKPETVVVGYLSGGTTTLAFTQALNAATAYMIHRGYQVQDFPQLVGALPKQSGPRIAAGRNSLVEHFLQTGADWLFMVDDDMRFEKDAIEQLLMSADPTDRPIVGGLCFGGGRDGWFPTMYQMGDTGLIRLEAVLDGVVPVDATGGAALLIHRTVFETLAEKYEEPWVWFQESTLGTSTVGEDITFCFRARAAGFPIYVNTDVEFGHMKLLEVNRRFYETWRDTNRFVVTGTGRSGTGYLSKVLTKLGVPCFHEETFTPAGVDWEWRRGDSSWMAAPHLPHFDGYVLHLVRDPLDVINSMTGIGFFDDTLEAREAHGMWRLFAEEHAPQVFGLSDPVERAMAWYVEWNRLIERYADKRLQVETVTGEDLLDLVRASGAWHSPHEIQQAIDKVDTTINTRRRASLTWDDLPDGETLDELRIMVKEYGYET